MTNSQTTNEQQADTTPVETDLRVKLSPHLLSELVAPDAVEEKFDPFAEARPERPVTDAEIRRVLRHLEARTAPVVARALAP